MAEFKQHEDARAILQAAVQEHIANRILDRPSREVAEDAGVSVRTVDRWKAWLRGDRSPHRARDPFKSSADKIAAAAGGGTMHVDMTMHIGGNPKYEVVRATEVEMDENFLAEAMKRPDDGWETFFGEYGINAGVIIDAEVFFEG